MYCAGDFGSCWFSGGPVFCMYCTTYYCLNTLLSITLNTVSTVSIVSADACRVTDTVQGQMMNVFMSDHRDRGYVKLHAVQFR